MTPDERRAVEHPELVKQYTDVGFTHDQAVLLTNKILDRRKPWRREIWAVAVISFIIGAIGWANAQSIADDAKMAANDAEDALEQVEAFAGALRNSAVKGCKRQNLVRAQQHVIQDVLRDMLRADIKDTKRIRPADFPDIPEHRFERLLRREIKHNQEARQKLKHRLELALCEKAYPTQIKESQG